MDPSKREFLLPGVQRHPRVTSTKLMYATILAYSSTNNTARVEHITYSIWNHILVALTDDREDLVVAPQWLVRLFTAHDQDLGDTSFDTQPNTRTTRILVPDFAVIQMKRKNSETPLPLLRLWRQVKLKQCPVPVLVEAKRPPSRRIADTNFRATKEIINRAQKDASNQASYLFSRKISQPWVIIIASSGKWWRWRIVTKKQIETELRRMRKSRDGDFRLTMKFINEGVHDAPSGSESSEYGNKSDEDVSEESEGLDFDGKREGEDDSEDEEDDSEDGEDTREEDNDGDEESNGRQSNEYDEPLVSSTSDGPGESRHSNISSDAGSDEDEDKKLGMDSHEEEMVQDDINDSDAAPRPDEWCGYIRLWNPAHNQRMYLIHQKLQERL